MSPPKPSLTTVSCYVSLWVAPTVPMPTWHEGGRLPQSSKEAESNVHLLSLVPRAEDRASNC